MTKEETIRIAEKIETLIATAKPQKARQAIETLTPVGLFGIARENKSDALALAQQKVDTLRRQADRA